MLRNARVTSSRRQVGILFIVFGAGAPANKLAGYVQQVLLSGRMARASNPQLAVGLIADAFTNGSLTPERTRSVFTEFRWLKLGARFVSPWHKRLAGNASPQSRTL